MKLHFLCFLSLFIPSLEAISILNKRDYINREYYTLHTTATENQIEAIKRVALSLGAQYEGQVGELTQHHWISIPMSNNNNNLMEQFQHAKLTKRDFAIVDSIQAQIPSRRLYKRAPPPFFDEPIVENTIEEHKLNNDPIPLPSLSDTNGYQAIKDILDIHDPGFDEQWHLVKYSMYSIYFFN